MRILLILILLSSCVESESYRRARISEDEKIEQMRELISLQSEFNRLKNIDTEKQRQDINKSLNEMLTQKFDRVQLVYYKAKVEDYKLQVKVLKDSLIEVQKINDSITGSQPTFNRFKKRKNYEF